MTLGVLYRGSLSLSLDVAHNTILNTLQERGQGNNYSQLQKDLNEYFYGQKVMKDSINNVDHIVNRSLEDHAVEILESLEIGNPKDVRKYKENGKQQAMLASTLQKMISELGSKVQQLDRGLTSSKSQGIDISSVQVKIDKLKETLQLANAALNEAKGKLIKGSTGQNFSKENTLTRVTALYNQMYTYNQALEGFSSISEATGEVLEVGLTKFGQGYNNWATSVGNSLVDEAFAERTGKDTQRRGGELVELTEIDIKKIDTNKAYTLTEEHTKSKNVNMTTTYDTGSKKQIKMDVSFYISGGNYGEAVNNFRISAKNWAKTGDYGSLGETNLLSALSRSSNKQAEFSLGMLSNYLDYTAFELGRLSIMADIAAGLSQKTGYANTLVVNTGSAIKVIDIGTVIENAMKQSLAHTTGMHITGYSFAPLKQTALNTLNGLKNVDSPGRTRSFLNMYYGYLKNIKVSMSINANKLAVK